MSEKERFIEEIIHAEWIAFDQVQNEGGRASCQDDFPTFSIMRKSQYMAWEQDMLEEYLYHFVTSLQEGRNLITEKYGRMMESTSPQRYAQIQAHFPILSAQRKQIQEEIIRIQVGWMEEVSLQYPKFAGNARSIHTAEDSLYNTSYETYLRGELSTYSEELLAMYGRFVVTLLQQGKNLAHMIMTNTANLYGYDSIADAQTRM